MKAFSSYTQFRNATALALIFGVFGALIAGCGGATQSANSVPSSGLIPSGAALSGHQVLSSAPSSSDIVNQDGRALHFKAIPLPTGFVPAAIMKDGAIPGKIGKHAAVFRDGRLIVLKDFPGCVSGEQAEDFSISATSANVHGDVVGFCDYKPSLLQPVVGIPLLYENGNVKPLSYPIEIPTVGAFIQSASINDVGVIVATANIPGNDSSQLYRLFRDGRQGTFLTGTGFQSDPINDNNEIANTVFTPDGGNAWVTRITGQSVLIIPTPGSASIWINDRNDVVGSTQAGAFVYHDQVVTNLPSPALVATGINNTGDIIGIATGGIFLSRRGITRVISSEIAPHADYSLLNTASRSPAFNYLIGLSNCDEFIATTGGGHFYLIALVDHRDK